MILAHKTRWGLFWNFPKSSEPFFQSTSHRPYLQRMEKAHTYIGLAQADRKSKNNFLSSFLPYGRGRLHLPQTISKPALSRAFGALISQSTCGKFTSPSSSATAHRTALIQHTYALQASVFRLFVFWHARETLVCARVREISPIERTKTVPATQAIQ